MIPAEYDEEIVRKHNDFVEDIRDAVLRRVDPSQAPFVRDLLDHIYTAGITRGKRMGYEEASDRISKWIESKTGVN